MAKTSTSQSAGIAPVTPRTLVDNVVEAIIFAAAEGHLRPGERVIEAELSRQLDISRVPVREALRLLESQGIVESTPYRGMRLMKVDDEQIENTIKVRFALERLAAEEYLTAIKTENIDLSPLVQIVEQMRIASRYEDYLRLALADTEFHRTFCGLTGNSVLLNAWQPLSRKMTIIFGIAAAQKGLDSIVDEHVQLLEAIKKKDRRLILATLKEHIFAYLDLSHQIDRHSPPAKPQGAESAGDRTKRTKHFSERNDSSF